MRLFGTTCVIKIIIKGEISKEEISKNEEPESAYKIYDKNYYIPK